MPASTIAGTILGPSAEAAAANRYPHGEMVSTTEAASRESKTARGGVLRRLRGFREDFVLERTSPEFTQALTRTCEIEGFTSPIELSLLYQLARATDSGAIVEIGSYLGRSTVVLANAERDSGGESIVAVDPHTAALGYRGEQPQNTLTEFLANIERAGVTSFVRLMHMKSAQAAAEWDGSPVRLLFVDGWHSYEAVIEDVSGWAPFFGEGTCVVFDDFLPSPGVRSAVRELRDRDILKGRSLIVGKMIAFGPPSIVREIRTPPGSRTLSRLGDRSLDLAIRLFAT